MDDLRVYRPSGLFLKPSRFRVKLFLKNEGICRPQIDIQSHDAT